MSLYSFADISHHKGDLDIQTFADAGHRLCVSKASDSYNMPDKDNQYHWWPQRHHDSRFVQNYVGTHQVGLIPAAYHFVRFDRPLPVAGRQAIIEANLTYFQDAIRLLPEDQQKISCAIIDIEQRGTQLKEAGLDKRAVSNMARAIVELFEAAYARLILYSGSWWAYEWLTPETTKWMAERMAVWEPEYVAIDNNLPKNMGYKPSVPVGFSNEYATSADDFIGKMFAWQFTSSGRFPGIRSNIDLNLTALPKEELYKIFEIDGAVDPPKDGEPPKENNCSDKIKAALGCLSDLFG